MAIHKKVPDHTTRAKQNTWCCRRFPIQPTDALAQLVIDAWDNPGSLLDRDPKTKLPTKGAVNEATRRINAAGLI